MLTLEKPIRIGPQIYDVLIGGVRGSWDVRAGLLEVMIGPARSKDGNLYLGTREKDGDQSKLLAPPLLSTLTIQNSFPPDPALAQVFLKLGELIEAIEAVVVHDESLQAQVYQAGEEEMSLACTFTPTPPGSIKLEEREKRPKEERTFKKEQAGLEE